MVKVGKFALANFKCELWLDPESSSAHFHFPDEKKDLGQMVIGIRKPFDNHEQVAELLLHESFEVAALVLDCRYERFGNHSSQDMLFNFTHEQFNRICKHQAEFIAEALPHTFHVMERIKKGKKP